MTLELWRKKHAWKSWYQGLTTRSFGVRKRAADLRLEAEPFFSSVKTEKTNHKRRDTLKESRRGLFYLLSALPRGAWQRDDR